MSRCDRLLKLALILITTILLLTFILPYDPEAIYGPTSPSLPFDNKPRVALDTSAEKVPDNPEKEKKIPEGPRSDDEKAEAAAADDAREKKKMFVILVTGFRTGSTFLGELFNQNGEVLYLFEPFHQNHINGLAKKHAIQGVDESNSLLEQRTAYLGQIINQCDVAWPMFPQMSEGMKCKTPEENLRQFGSKSCDGDRWNRACQMKDIVALKLIRLQRIAHLELVPGIKEANVRVIHLIRDPRGTMNSRSGWGQFYLDDLEPMKVRPLTPEKMTIAANNLCERETENIRYSQNLPEWLQGRYLRITHDEMSLEPVESAEKVYQFLGRKIPADMGDFLIEHTTVQKKGALNTSKDSKAILEKWKSNLDLPIIRAVEDSCKELMEIMKYDPYDPDVSEQ